MKKIKIIILSTSILAIIVVASGFTKTTSSCGKTETTTVKKSKQNQTINMFVTHGHCSLPFAGVVNDLRINLQPRNDKGNPLEEMNLSFNIDPNSFNACRGEDLTERVKTPGLFIGDENEKITFKSTNVYTMGLDWYQVNGRLSIKGVERDVKFFVTGIRDPKDSMPSSLVLEGQVNLFDWDIDYDKIVNGKSSSMPTKLLHINMRFGMC